MILKCAMIACHISVDAENYKQLNENNQMPQKSIFVKLGKKTEMNQNLFLLNFRKKTFGSFL